MNPRATVIIPTFGNAPFIQWALRSVQNQTIRDIEICIICDGSPDHMVSQLDSYSIQDTRIQVHRFPKSPRTGEPYRDLIIKRTQGAVICYCAHDDLWLPNHIEEMEKSLKQACFTHSIHTSINVPELILTDIDLISVLYPVELNSETRAKMLAGINHFGLTYGAHTRASYFELKEGWVTTPRPEVPTDLYMWCKFIAQFPDQCRTWPRITALCFPQIPRKWWSEENRNEELRQYFEKMKKRSFIKKLHEIAHEKAPSMFPPALPWYKKLLNFLRPS